MQLDTKHFGVVEINEEGILDFPEGLPSFEHVKKFVILDASNEETPFKWLQSVDEPDLAFVIVDPFKIKNDYEVNIKDEVLEAMGIEKAEDVLIYSIVVIPEDVSLMTMNLRAPLVINVKNKRGMQVVLDTDRYSVRHYILEELRRQEVGAHACSDKKEGTIHHNK
ncbi:MAG: flagellar assembly protein FliW [Clostridiales bacterium]|nr:flagellar assembly protein FliW [Eubacteriales bacterium]MDH7566168.1 flagellar assembly protein FliW [Clostridiales bacterium]